MRIATRGSALALAQARWIASRLPGEHELVEVVTSGDRRRDVDDKREWILELEEALLRGDADLAVHSAKDVPVEIADGLALIASPPRADPRDVLCGASSLDVLPTVRALRSHGDEVVSRVLEENAGRWEGATPRDLARIEAVARAVANRLLHEPTIRLKSLGHGRQQIARDLFGLDEGTSEAIDEPAENVRALRRRA